jgi:hypothetical protein
MFNLVTFTRLDSGYLGGKSFLRALITSRLSICMTSTAARCKTHETAGVFFSESPDFSGAHSGASGGTFNAL